jgi:hypothetical protein
MGDTGSMLRRRRPAFTRRIGNHSFRATGNQRTTKLYESLKGAAKADEVERIKYSHCAIIVMAAGNYGIGRMGIETLP